MRRRGGGGSAYLLLGEVVVGGLESSVDLQQPALNVLQLVFAGAADGVEPLVGQPAHLRNTARARSEHVKWGRTGQDRAGQDRPQLQLSEGRGTFGHTSAGKGQL